MSFASPEWLGLLLLLLILTSLGARRGTGRVLGFPAVQIATEVPASLRRRAFTIRRAFFPLGVAWLVIALAGPRWDHHTTLPEGHGVDALIVLDVSSSMQRTDLSSGRRGVSEPGKSSGSATRLDIAREVIADFIRRRPNDRMGLMTFARFARSACPMTVDHDALFSALAAVRPVVPGSDEDQTGVGVALATAIQQVAESDAKSRVVVLLTDGEETVNALSSQEAAEFGKAAGVRVYTIAVGRRVGEWAEALAASAASTGGRGYVARGADELRGIYDEIDRLEVSELDQVHLQYHTPLHAAAVLIGLVFLLFGPLLDATWFRRAP